VSLDPGRATMWQRAKKTGRAFHPVKFGIGLNTGECTVGNMGSKLCFDYSALDDEVNIASPLEGSSKQFGVDIVASAHAPKLRISHGSIFPRRSKAWYRTTSESVEFRADIDTSVSFPTRSAPRL
jgi:hypothetical protein